MARVTLGLAVYVVGNQVEITCEHASFHHHLVFCPSGAMWQARMNWSTPSNKNSYWMEFSGLVDLDALISWRLHFILWS